MAERFGPFELIDRLGSGGMAEVWRAVLHGESGFAKQVALKRILPHRLDEPDLLTGFRDEARLCSRLSHPHVVEVFDFGAIDGVPYLSMELIRGWTLAQLLWRGQPSRTGLALPAVYSLGLQITRGLAYAHAARDADGRPLGVIHRDLKPGNLMITAAGQAKVMDFGVAKAATNVFATRTDVARGTPCYMSPEMCEAEPLDHRSDLFGLAAILAECVLGYPIFLEETQYRTMYRIAGADVTAELEAIAAVDAALATVLERAFRRDPADRFDDAAAMGDALAAAAGDPAPAEAALLDGARALLALPAPETDDEEQRPAVLSAPPSPDGEPPGLASPAPTVIDATPSGPDRGWTRRRGPALAVVLAIAATLAVGAVWRLAGERSPTGVGEVPWSGDGAPADGRVGADGAVSPGPNEGVAAAAGTSPGAGVAPGGDGPPVDAETDRDDAAAERGDDRDGQTEARDAGDGEPSRADDGAPSGGDDADGPDAPPGFVWREPDPAALQAIVGADPGLKACFEAAVDGAPADAVELQFAMGADGIFDALAIAAPDAIDPSLGTCLSDRLRAMRFEPTSFDWTGTLRLRPPPRLELPPSPPG